MIYKVKLNSFYHVFHPLLVVAYGVPVQLVCKLHAPNTTHTKGALLHSYLLFFSKLVRTFSLLLDFYRIVHTFCFLVSHVLNKTYRPLIVDIQGKNMDALVSSASFLFLSCIIKALQISP